MKFNSFSTLLLVLAFSLPLAAQRPQRGGADRRQNLSQMDTNGDGKISKSEWTGPSAAFDRADLNHDGYITTDEIGQRRGGLGAGERGANLRQMDSNNDGKISRDEWKGPSGMFDQIDVNKDGYITLEEMRQNRRPAAGGQGQGRGSALSRMDANSDGNISREEWKGTAEMFDRMDANHDGLLTQDEIRQARR